MINGGGRSDLQMGLSPLYCQELRPQTACLNKKFGFSNV